MEQKLEDIKHVFPDVATYCNESCRICFLARTYIALAMSPTTSTSPSAQAAAPNNAGPWDGARAGDNDWFLGGYTPILIIENVFIKL